MFRGYVIRRPSSNISRRLPYNISRRRDMLALSKATSAAFERRGAAFKFSQPRRGDGVRPGQGYHRRRQRGVVPFEVGFGASGRAVRAGLASRLRLICVYDVDEVPLEDPEQLLSAFTCPPPNAFARSAARRAPDRPRSWVRRRASPDSSLVRLLAIFIRADVSMRIPKTQNPHSAERALLHLHLALICR